MNKSKEHYQKLLGARKVRPRQGKSVDPREVELKFHLPPGGRAALEASPALVAATAKQHHLVTTYFDTPDGLLDRAGLTLRIRRSGNTHIQTVKSRSNGRGVATSRREWEWPARKDVPDVGRLAETRALATAARAIKGRLEPVFVTDIRRTTRLLHLDGNTVVEVAIDEGSVEASAKREPVSELELELKEGCIGPVYRLAAELQALAPMWLSPESKAARGWHLRAGQTEGGQLAEMPKLGRLVQAAAGFHEILSGTLGHLTANIGATMRGDPEALHQMRIAIRKSRAVLQLFERHLEAAAAGCFNARLRRFGEIFGAARDWDVFCLETLSVAMADLPLERLEDLNLVAEVQRQFAHAAVANAVRGHDFTAMVLGLAIWAEAGVTQPSTLGDDRMSNRLAALVPSLLDRAAGKAKHRGRHASRLSAAERHGLRKSLKKLSYDVESLGGLYPPRAVKIYRDRCQALEEILGVANDAVVTQRLALTLVTPIRPDLAKPAGALTRWSERRGRKALQSLKAALKDFRATPAFWS
jgi:triphosphatase